MNTPMSACSHCSVRFVCENRLGPLSSDEDDDLKRSEESKDDDDLLGFQVGDKVRVETGENGVVFDLTLISAVRSSSF